MKNYVDKKFFSLKKKIINKFKNTNKNALNLNLIIQHLIFLNLKIENILFKNKDFSKQEIYKNLENFYEYIFDLNKFTDFSDKKKISEYRFVKEKIHKTLFQKLFVIYSIKEFKKSRLKRFVRRIKINKLSSLIKNKKIVDFGCGHGNFLMSLNKFNPKKRVGIDYGISSIKMAKRLKTKLFPKSKISFLLGSVYKTKLKSKYFDFAIQNGVFHHLNYELKAYKEVHRVLKKNGYFWIYTDGGGGIRDFIFDMSQEILSKIDEDFVQRQISSIGLNIGKQYHLGDTLRAKYSHTDLPTIKKQLNKIGFKFVRQLRGGYKTDFDYPFSKDKNFKEKFGSGDLRLLFRKK